MKLIRILAQQHAAPIFAVLLLCFGSTYGQIRKTDVEHDGFKGKVRIVLEETVKLSNKGGKLTEGRRRFYSKWTYDKGGMLVKEEIKGSHRLYRYDTDGNRHEKRSSRWMSGPPTAEDFHYQQEKAADGSSLYKWVSKYDSAGNRIEEKVFSGSQETHSQFMYKYDDRGRRVETIYKTKDSPTKRFTYSYDEAGRIREKLVYNGSDTVASERQRTFEFDPTGNWVKSTTFVVRKKEGKEYEEPVEVKYRTITNY